MGAANASEVTHSGYFEKPLRNPKPEGRSPKEIRNPNGEIRKRCFALLVGGAGGGLEPITSAGYFEDGAIGL
jgi:hypothetical protein